MEIIRIIFRPPQSNLATEVGLRGTFKSGGAFTGWMLLNYKKPVRVSSTLGGYHANYAVDENIKTYWSAASGNKGEWIQTDLGNVSTVNAIQINYADQDADSNLGKQTNINIININYIILPMEKYGMY